MKCLTCKYWRKLATGGNAKHACLYILKTGQSRGCEPGDLCDKYTQAKKEKPKPFSLKR